MDRNSHPFSFTRLVSSFIRLTHRVVTGTHDKTPISDETLSWDSSLTKFSVRFYVGFFLEGIVHT